MNKYTPGPWEITKGAYGDTLVTSTHEKDGIDDDVCLVYGGNDSDPKTMSANASLIAAAPELLAALEDVVASTQANCSGSLANAITAGQAAIDKATKE